MQRSDVTFTSGGTTIAAWHYAAATEGTRPCVVLAHGFAMVRDAGLDRYAERFAAAGLDALVFDYRCFGASAGEPRQWLDVGRQLEDWRAAIAFARTLASVDPVRVALWGTSFSGGHVAALAADDPGLAAIVSQVPFSGLGGRTGPRRLGHQLRLVLVALADAAAGRLGYAPRYLRIVADPPAFAAFNLPGAVHEVGRLVGEGSTWENRFTPRVMLQMATYKPFADAAQIRCPWLLVVSDPDTITPSAIARERAAPAPRLTVRRHQDAHFAVYAGQPFERLVAEQIAFLRGHLVG